jgi:signal transduction histidine kinase
MRLLPKLVTPIGALGLPLPDHTAGQLMNALLCEQFTGRSELMSRALANDPVLALWAVCLAEQADCGPFHKTSQLADWLADDPLSKLSWHADVDRSSTPPGEIRELWADRAAGALGVARLAVQLAGAFQADPERAYLSGLLHAAPQWMAFAIGYSSDVDPAKILPGWLNCELASIRNETAHPNSHVRCVALALKLSEPTADTGNQPEMPSGFLFDAAGHRAQVACLRELWLTASGAGEALQTLADRLSRLAKLEREFARTLEAEKLESLKELAYGAGHEINNPLANISARAQTLLQDERDPERRRKLAAINTQAFRAHEMIADMMLFARPPRPKFEQVDLSELLARLVEELTPRAGDQNTQLAFAGPEVPIVVSADKTQLEVAVRALCTNALEALVTGGHVELALHSVPTAQASPAQVPLSDETVQIAVSDSGPGISDEARRHIFDPFYSGREAGRGLGFGLSKCWRIVEMHAGTIDVESRAGCGAVFTITLPVHQPR